MRLFAKELADFFIYFGHSGHAADQNHLINIAGAEPGIFQSRLTRFHRGFDQITHKAFQFRTGKFHHHMQWLAGAGIHRNKRLVDFGLRGR